MSPDQQQPAQESSPVQAVSFKEFLERIPSATVCAVTNIAREEVTGRGTSFYPLTLPTLELHCENRCSAQPAGQARA
jgi:hypothetical protein